VTLDTNTPTHEDGLAFLADPRFAAALRRVQHQLERLAARLDDVRDNVDAAARALQVIVDQLPGALVMAPRGAARPVVVPEEQAVLRAEADAGVPSLEVTPHADGSLDVRISGRRAFRLPSLLASLLSILAAPGPCAEDGLLGWRTKIEVAAALAKRTDHAVTPRDVTKIVHRLRKAFHEAGENWFLVQTHRQLGVRFALRCDRW
jgi:hypothetical protein